MQIDLLQMERSLAMIEERLMHFSDVLPQDTQYKAMFVCEEILTNLQRHANFEERTPDVSLALERQNENLELIFKDNASTFNLLDFPDPDLNEDLESRKIGGLGVFLTKKYAKKLDYNSDKHGNTLKVIL